MNGLFLVKFLSDERLWTLLMISQGWFRWWLGALCDFVSQYKVQWNIIPLYPGREQKEMKPWVLGHFGRSEVKPDRALLETTKWTYETRSVLDQHSNQLIRSNKI